MNDSLAMGRVQRISNLDAKRQNHLRIERAPRDTLFQSHPFQQLHGNERLAVLFADVVNGADVRVIEGGSSLGFALKAGERLGIAGYLIGEELEGNKTVKPSIFSLVDHAHATATELLNDAVVGDGLADHSAEILGAQVRQVNEAHGRGSA